MNGKELSEMETDDLINYINGESNKANKNNPKGKKKNKKKIKSNGKYIDIVSKSYGFV